MTPHLWRVSLLILIAGVCAGCIGFLGPPKVATHCPFDQAWSVALASLDEFDLERVDESKGTIETSWLTVQATTKAGVLERDVNKERVRFIVDVETQGQGASVAVQQFRETWSPMGSRYREWFRISPHRDEETRLAKRIEKRLQDREC